jgi:hypothetical protein
LDAALEEVAVGFQKLDAAQQRPRCMFETGIGLMALLPHAQTAREVARALEMKTQRDVEQGKLDDALRNIERLLRLSRDLRPRGPLISQLVSISLYNICCNDLVKRIFASPDLTPQHCDQLLAALIKHEQQASEPFVEGLRSEYVMTRMALHDIQHRTGEFDPKRMREEFELQSDSIGAVILAFGTAEDVTGQLAAQIDARIAKMTAEDYARERALLNDAYESLLSVTDQPFAEQVRRVEAANAVFRNQSQLVSLFEGGNPRAFDAFVRAKGLLHGTQCLVALRRWELTQPGVAPADLESVCKAAGLKEIPRDPYSDGPLRMTQVANRVVVYSIGNDGKDDKAAIDWNYGQQPGDFIFVR